MNAEIRRNAPPRPGHGLRAAVAGGAMALFGEKYEQRCTRTAHRRFFDRTVRRHARRRAGDIGFFNIVSEGGVASGIRRIEAITGEAAIEYVEQSEAMLKEIVRARARLARGDARTRCAMRSSAYARWSVKSRTLKDRLAPGREPILLPAPSISVASRSWRQSRWRGCRCLRQRSTN